MLPPRFLPPAAHLILLTLMLFPADAAEAQKPPPGDSPTLSTPPKTKKIADLTGRYRFSERYTNDDKAAGPGVVGSYRVAILEVTRDSTDSAQGAPKRVESTRQAIYSERAAEMGGDGAVASTTRALEKFVAKPEDPSKTMGSRPLEGASVLYRPKPGELPTIFNLAVGRPLTDYEYDVLAHQTYMPHLAAVLPVQVVRLGDSWRIPRKAAQALLGESNLQGDALVGNLGEIRKEVDGPRMVASIGVTGKVAGPGGETGLNAEILFTFLEPAPPRPNPAATKAAPATPPPNPARTPEDVMEARGAITEVRMARVTSGPLPGPGRLRFQSNRELTLHRQLGVLAGSIAPPSIGKVPEPNETNSWLTLVDPSGRYSLRHPQELQPSEQPVPSTGKPATVLLRTRREGRDLLQIEFDAKTLAPEDLKKELAEKSKSLKVEVLKGDEGWLPEIDWPKMRVYRVDTALKVGESRSPGTVGSPRIHLDGYLIQFAQSSSILAIATTSRESVAPFRREVEQILKSIQLDPTRSVGN